MRGDEWGRIRALNLERKKCFQRQTNLYNLYAKYLYFRLGAETVPAVTVRMCTVLRSVFFSRRFKKSCLLPFKVTKV